MHKTSPKFTHPLVFLRHGATQWNSEGKYQGATDTNLSPAGTNDAEANAKLLQKLVTNGTLNPKLLSIVSSPLNRAKQTAAIILEHLDACSPVRFDPAFREISLGRWEGLTSFEVKSQFYEERKGRKSNRWNFAPEGGESMADRVEEVESALRSAAPHTIIVTHAVILRVILNLLGGLSKDQASIEHPNHVGLIVWDGAILHRQGFNCG